MVAYCVRRLVGGVATLFVLSFAVYSITMSTSLELFRGSEPPQCPVCFREWLVREVKIDRPWPLNYLAWLFDPTDYSEEHIYYRDYYPHESTRGIDLVIGSLHIKGSGVLTGDLGTSWLLERGTPVLDVFGPGLVELLLATTATIFLLMAIATAQRLRRPFPYTAAAKPPPFPTERIRWLT